MSEGAEEIENAVEGSLLKMKKGIASNYWKKHWVYADSEYLYQWQSNSKPKPGEPPKYTCCLADCHVEESQIRKFAFKLTEKTSKETMVFAADDFDTYESWLKVLFGNVEFDESDQHQATTETQSEGTAAYSDDFKHVSSDRIADYFFEHDVAKDAKNPCVTDRDLRRLLHTLDASLNAANTATAIMHDLNIKPGASVSHEVFRDWWTTHSSLLAVRQDPRTPPQAAGAASLLSQTVNADRILFAQVGSSGGDEGGACSDFLYRARVPRLAAYEHLMAVGGEVTAFDEIHDWNDLYQSLREQASLTQSWHLAREDDAAFEDEWSNYRVLSAEQLQEQLEARQQSALLQPTSANSDHHTPKFSTEDGLKACLRLAAFYGVFNRLAVDGAKILIDEYSLPDGMKSAQRVPQPSSGSDTAAEDIDAASRSEASSELFEYCGLLLRVVASPATEQDRAPDAARTRELAATDEVLHKAAGLEQTGLGAFQSAMERLSADQQARDHWHHALHHKSDKFRHLLRPCTLLTTLVDYAGYRVHVSCPAHIMEQFTLMHGFASPRAAAEATGVAADSEDFVQESEADADEVLFVNALPAYRSVLQQLSATMNLLLSRRLLSVCSSSLFDSEDHVATVHVELLTERLQAHKGTDDRLYSINFASLYPLDLPRPDSVDHLTRALRPEFVRRFRSPLSAEALLSANGATDAAAVENVAACSYLYTVHLPQLARTLDSLQDLIPTDSFSATRWLHAHGASCRHMGVLYSLSKTPCVRQLLLTECIARCAKVLLGQVLRRVARKCKAESLLAEHRRRSKHNDFVELVDVALARRREAVCDLFNALFGLSSADGRGTSPSDEFWSGALSSALFHKFGLNLQSVLRSNSNNRASLVHFPSLFLAVQYHTNCRFKDIPYAHLVQSSSGNRDGTKLASSQSVFTADDIVHCCLPSCDVQQQQLLPGELGRVAASAEAFLLSGMFAEAAHAFQLRLSFQSHSYQRVPPSKGAAPPPTVLTCAQDAELADTVYKLALSQYANQQYGEARNTIRTQYMARCMQHYSAATGRMLTLLMSVEYRCGRFDKVRAYFDAAQSVYSYALGVDHPAISLHMCALADLYHESGFLAQSNAMLVLAHSVSRKAVGEHHLISALLQCKLAVLKMKERNFKEASLLLSGTLAVLDGLGATSLDANRQSSGAANDEQNRLGTDVADCLCALTECFAQCDELDLAIHSGFRCVETCAQLLLAPHNQKLAVIRVSCLLTLCDLFVQKAELDSAFGLLHEAWTLVHHTSSMTPQTAVHSSGHSCGRALAALACRILELSINSLPMQTRSLFHSVAEEAVLRGHHLTAAQDSDEAAREWERAVALVCASLWKHRPADYLNMVIQGVQSAEISDKHGVVAKKERIADAAVATLPFALQAAVISRLVKNPHEFSQKYISL